MLLQTTAAQNNASLLKMVDIILLVVEGVVLIPMALLYLTYLRRAVARDRVKLYSIFLRIPRPFVVVQAKADVKLVGEGNDDDEDEEPAVSSFTKDQRDLSMDIHSVQASTSDMCTFNNMPACHGMVSSYSVPCSASVLSACCETKKQNCCRLKAIRQHQTLATLLRQAFASNSDAACTGQCRTAGRRGRQVGCY